MKNVSQHAAQWKIVFPKKTLLYGEKHPCNVAKLSENIPKNRFKTTFPYDHSRVILVNTHSDYINASFIDGLKTEKVYIAAQGPKPTTISDFWSMLKSAQYWPDLHETITCDRTTLHSIKEQQYAHAGIGRTGTYIAIDVLFEAGKTEKKINIAEYVKKMRQNRMNMVQTFEQYKTIFLTLNEMFKATAAALTKTDFVRKLQKQNKNMLGKEFQRLLSVRPHYAESDYKMSSHVHGVRSAIRPLDKYIIYLTSNVPKRGSYINAIVVPSFINQNAFIITHFPAPGDAVDFLRLITDHDCELVVSTEPLHEVESKSNETWSVNVIQPSSILTLDNLQTVSQILGLVSFTQNITTNNPIIVFSRDGAALCGVFCAVHNLIQQLTMDEEIDVFSVVRLLQTRRPEMCSSLEEYRIIHDTLKSFIQLESGENVYYNQLSRVTPEATSV
uniref:Receptor-type tyrosine-protein phosphatase T n=1 Tax=Magallana gigas TaxID=29159 RepID=K1QY72_MAGGI